MTLRAAVLLLPLLALLLLSTAPQPDPRVRKLSEYGFFTGALAHMQPAEGVLPYELNSPLFSDYALKARFIKLPEGTQMVYDPDEVLDLPVGTAIAKTFYYPEDLRKPDGARRLIETRVLLHEPKGWVALPYVWDEAQTEAVLEVTGATQAVSWIDEAGKARQLDYRVPNVNQCKGCHLRGKDVVPIGPSARQLNRPFAQGGAVAQNQLAHWAAEGHLAQLPDMATVPAITDWQDASAALHDRARAYLDINCAHCHRPDGPASTSGMFLQWSERDPTRWGVNKAPVAAGRAAGKRRYGIVPGKPQQSILLYRMESEDAGIMMPEIGRKMIHREGVALIKDWIAAM